MRKAQKNLISRFTAKNNRKKERIVSTSCVNFTRSFLACFTYRVPLPNCNKKGIYDN